MENLITYYSNISPFVGDDETFIRSVKNTWGIGDKVCCVAWPHMTFRGFEIVVITLIIRAVDSLPVISCD